MNEQSNKQVISQDREDRTNKVNDDGTIEVVEVLKTKYVQGCREFLSDIRRLKKMKMDIEKTLEPEFAERQRKSIGILDIEINKLEPVYEEAEKKYLAHQQESRKKTIVDRLKVELAKPNAEINMQYIAAAWDNISKNEKDILERLTKEEITRFKVLKLKAVAKGRRNP